MFSFKGWQEPPELLLERVEWLNAKHDWGFSANDLPSVPSPHSRLNRGEGIILGVFPESGKGKTGLQRAMDDWWARVQAPKGFFKRRSMVRSEPYSLRLAPGYEYEPGVRWMVFNPTSFPEMSPEKVLDTIETVPDGFRAAGVEVLMASALCPRLASSWGKNIPYAQMTGLQLYWQVTSEWSVTPVLRLEGSPPLGSLLFAGVMSNYVSTYACSPTVREL